MKTLTQKDLEKGLSDTEKQRIFFEEDSEQELDDNPQSTYIDRAKARLSDKSKKKDLPTKQWHFYRDPGHAWLSVTRKELIDLHIDRIISKHSYQKGKIVYLEEDLDANIFLNKIVIQGKCNIELLDRPCDKDSIIRTYERYAPEDSEQEEKKRAKIIKDRNTHLDKPPTEYRYENTATKQGHYFTDLSDCLNAARPASLESPADTFLIEQYRPKRLPLATIKNDTLEFVQDKPFTVQSAEKTDSDLRILRKSNHGMHSIPEIIKSLQAIADSKCIKQPAHREACLYNAIERLEDLQEKEESTK